MIRGILIAILVFAATVFCRENTWSAMDSIAVALCAGLELDAQSTLAATAITEDRVSMLDARPLFKALQASLCKVIAEVRLNPFQGGENAALRDLYLRSAASMEYRHFELPQREIDSLLLVCHIYVLDKGNITFVFKMLDLRSTVLFESVETKLSRSEAIPSVERAIFRSLSDIHSYRDVRYRARLIGKLEKLFSSGNADLLSQPAQYSFHNMFPSAQRWQVELLKEILTLRYGMGFRDGSGNRILLDQSGTLTFLWNETRRSVAGMVDVPPLLPHRFTGERGRYYYFRDAADTLTSARRAKTAGEKRTLKRIVQTVERRLPNAYDPFNPGLLRSLFHDNGDAILTGKKVADNPLTGEEEIRYRWLTRDEYLRNLALLHDRGFRFAVDLSVLGVFKDPLEPSRFWALVSQSWQTVLSGTPVYEDNGFLIMNFDFEADGVLRNFGIHCRLWFYDYQYDDTERGISRTAKLASDIDRYFLGDALRIDRRLKRRLKGHLLEKIRAGKAAQGHVFLNY